MFADVSLPVSMDIRLSELSTPVTLDNMDPFRAYLRKQLRVITCFIREKHPEDSYHELTLVSITSLCDSLNVDTYDYIRRLEDYLTRVDPNLPNRDILIEKAKHFVDTLYILRGLLRLESEYLER